MREKMLSAVIRRFGFEDSRTIAFASRCEKIPTSFLGNALLKTEFASIMQEDPFSED